MEFRRVLFRSQADQNSGVRVVGDSKFKFEIWNAGDSGRTLIKLPEVVANRASEAPSISADGNLLIYRDRSPISKSQDLVPLYRPTATRSEEHTSELQSLMRIPYAVFCLNKQNTTS